MKPTHVLQLPGACVSHGVDRFNSSSTAAANGMTGQALVPEDDPVAPTNLWGASKMTSERMNADVAAPQATRQGPPLQRENQGGLRPAAAWRQPGRGHAFSTGLG